MNLKLSCMIFLSLLLLSSVSAINWDNKLSYSNKDLKVDFRNAFGFGSDLGTAELKSHKSVTEVLKVGAGNQVTMYYDFSFGELYKNGLGEIAFIDMKTGKEVERNYRFVYWGSEEYESPIYSCSDSLNKNGTIENKCIQTGTETKTREKWLSYNSKDIPKGNIRIGIEVEVLKNDYIDGIWEIVGKKVKKHAEWNESIEAGLITYLTMDDASGNPTDSTGNYTYTNNGATANVGGIIGTCYDFENTDNDSISSDSEMPVLDDFSVSLWTKPESFGDEINVLFDFGYDGSNSSWFFHQVSQNAWRFTANGNVQTIWANNTVGQWMHFVLTREGTNASLYMNGSLVGSVTTSTTALEQYNFSLGHAPIRNENAYDYDGLIDEVGVWNRVLTQDEISDLYNGGSGISPSLVNNPPSITLNSPENYYNSTLQSITFNCTASDDINLVNVSFYLNGILNETNSSGLNNTNYIFTKVLTDGEYNWTCEGTDNESQTTTASYRYFEIDSTSPIINITFPIDSETYTTNYTNSSTIDIELNWTSSDSNLDSCWFYNGTANTTLTCGDNATITLPYGEHTLGACANDTFGFETCEYITSTWEFKVFEFNKTFSNETIEGNSEDFYLHLAEGSGYNIQSIILHYNGTTDTASLFSSGDNVSALSQIIIPSVSADANISFYFTITMSDSSSFNSTTGTQLVRNVAIDDCSSQPNLFMILNLVDEENQSLITGDIEVYLSVINPVNSQEVLSINATYSGVQNKSFCSDPPLNQTGYVLDAEIRYSADNYSAEFYNLQTSNLSTYPKTYFLYDLQEEDTTKFKILYRGEDLRGVEGAIVQLQRKYISEGLYKIVEAPLTSSDSTTIVHVDTKTNRYKATIVKDGELLDTFENLAFICQSELTGECTLDLSEFIIPPNSISIETIQDFAYTIDTSEDNVIDVVYSVPSGTTSMIQVVATQTDIIGTSTICNTTLSSAGGSIECSYNDSIQDSYIDYQIYKDSNPIAQKSYIVQDDLRDDFAGGNYFILIIIGLSLIFMAITSPEWIILNSIIVMIVGGATWLIRGMDFVLGLGAIAWLLLGAVIIIIKMAKQEDH